MRILFIYNGAEQLGIEYLSSVLKSKGHKTRLLFDPAIFSGDQLIHNQFLSKLFSRDKEIIKRAVTIRPDLVAFSAHSGNYRWCLKIAQEIRQLTQIPIVFGGVHATAVPEKVLLNDFIDYVVIGEGENAILDLIGQLGKGKSKRRLLNISNLCFKYKGEIHLNAPRPYIKDLDKLPFPDKKLFYDKVPLLAENSLIMTSRGCPYRCTYCSNDMYCDLYSKEGRQVRRRSPENVIEELKIAKRRWKTRFINFGDDVFISSTSWLKEFIPLYKFEINLPFFCSVHPLSISQENVDLLKEGGCWMVTMGVQSGSERIRKKIYHRAGSNQQILKAIFLIKKAGIKMSVDNIFGAPSEKEKDLKQSLKLYERARADRIQTFWLTFYPRTKVIDYARRYNLLTENNVKEIEDGIIGFTHATGSVNPNKIKMYLRYETLFHLRSLFRNRDYSFFARFIPLFPFKKSVSRLIIFLTALKNRDIKFFYLLRFLWANKDVP